jgi:hypothetical protein
MAVERARESLRAASPAACRINEKYRRYTMHGHDSTYMREGLRSDLSSGEHRSRSVCLNRGDFVPSPSLLPLIELKRIHSSNSSHFTPLHQLPELPELGRVLSNLQVLAS